MIIWQKSWNSEIRGGGNWHAIPLLNHISFTDLLESKVIFHKPIFSWKCTGCFFSSNSICFGSWGGGIFPETDQRKRSNVTGHVSHLLFGSPGAFGVKLTPSLGDLSSQGVFLPGENGMYPFFSVTPRNNLVWWLQPIWKILVKLDHFPR